MKIIDAHLHIGQPGVFFAPEYTPAQLLAGMDRLGFSTAICTDHLSLGRGCAGFLEGLRDVFERSGGRIFYFGVYHPGYSDASLRAMAEAVDWPGFAGIKIHPSFHRIPADDPSYEPVWRFAAEHDLPMMTHSWSVSDYNPVQQLSVPARFEQYVHAYPAVRFVLGHAGGRGKEQADAIRMARDYPNVYVDIAGDVYCHRLIERLAAAIPEKVLFGSDYPWLDLRSNFSRILLAEIDTETKRMMLCDNAQAVYRLDEKRC
ncbi:MAG: amidohydrolase family protein [Armatimonadota bacterium]